MRALRFTKALDRSAARTGAAPAPSSRQLLRRRAFAFLALAIAVLAIAAIVSIVSSVSSQRLFETSAEANTAIHDVDAIERIALTRELAARDFLLADGGAAARPTNAGDVRGLLDELAAAVGHDPARQAMLAQVRAALDAEQRSLAAVFDAYREHSRAAAIALAAGESAQRSAELRAALDALHRASDFVRASARRELIAQLGRADAIVAAAGLVALFTTALGAAFVRRGLQSQRHGEFLRREKERAERSELKKTNFLAHISHEIRTPMNAIIGFSRLLAERVTDPKQRNYVDAIVVSSKGLLALLEDVIDLARMEAGKLEIAVEPVNIEELVQSVIASSAASAQEKNVALSCEIADGVPDFAMLDGKRLRQVLANLVGNAVKFTDRGSVRVHIGAVPVAGSDAFTLTIAIVDTGCGIAAEDLARIFDPFERGPAQRDVREGTGLGLAVTQRLLEFMHGKLDVESRVGEGSRFTVELPNVVPAAVAPADPAGTAADLSALALGTVLIADDVKLNRDLLAGLLSAHAQRLLLAADGVEALDCARRERPDLILMDLRMPRMDGRTAVDRMRADAALRAVPVIAVTASNLHEQEPELRARFDGVVRKPVTIEALAAEIRSALQRHPQAVAGQAPSQAPERAAIDPATLRTELETLFAREWSEARAALAYHDVQALVTAAREVAARCGLRDLSEFAERLGAALARFDIVAMERELDNFPALVGHYRAGAGA